MQRITGEEPAPPPIPAIPVDDNEEEGAGDATPAPTVDATPRPRKRSQPKEDYESVFMSARALKRRKSVYLSEETHERVMLILHTIKKGELSVSGFLENVVLHHLETYKEEISALYESRQRKPY